MQEALTAAVADAEQDQSCRALLLTGAGRAFSSGQDLNERVTAAGEVIVPGEALAEILQPAGAASCARCPSPSSLRSTARRPGVSCNIALACDIVLAARSATFLQPFARLGIVPDGGGTWLLPRLVGQARARGLALLAEPLSAEKAEQWGLIWKVVDDAALMPEAEKLCAAFRDRADLRTWPDQARTRRRRGQRPCRAARSRTHAAARGRSASELRRGREGVSRQAQAGVLRQALARRQARPCPR